MKILSFLVLLLATFNAAVAGPPFVTDDPEPVDYQQWEVNYGITKTWREDETSAGIPSVDINYGFAPDIQLHIQPRYSFEKINGSTASGFDNTEIGMKYRFVNYHHRNSTFMVGVYPMLQLPTGNDKLGSTSGKTQSFLPIWFQEDFAHWTVYGGTGYRMNRGVNARNSQFTGIVTLYHLTNALQVGGEVFHESSSSIGESGSSGFNLGGIYSLVKNYQLLFSAGKGLNNISQNRLSVYAALQVLY